MPHSSGVVPVAFDGVILSDLPPPHNTKLSNDTRIGFKCQFSGFILHREIIGIPANQLLRLSKYPSNACTSSNIRPPRRSLCSLSGAAVTGISVCRMTLIVSPS